MTHQKKQKRIVSPKIETAIIVGENLIFEPHSHDEFVLSVNIMGDELLQLDGKTLKAPEGAVTLYNPAQMQRGEGTSFLASLYLVPDFFEHSLLLLI